MSLSSRDYLKAVKQRLTTARFLLEFRYTLDAMYLAGYAVECSLKALILAFTPEPDRLAMFEKISRGEAMHDIENPAGILKDLGRPVPSALKTRCRRFGWTTNLRFTSGRVPTSEVRSFLTLANDTRGWVEGELP